MHLHLHTLQVDAGLVDNSGRKLCEYKLIVLEKSIAALFRENSHFRNDTKWLKSRLTFDGQTGKNCLSIVWKFADSHGLNLKTFASKVQHQKW